MIHSDGRRIRNWTGTGTDTLDVGVPTGPGPRSVAAVWTARPHRGGVAMGKASCPVLPRKFETRPQTERAPLHLQPLSREGPIVARARY